MDRASLLLSAAMQSRLNTLQDIIGTDVGDRGMKSLIVPGDLAAACILLGTLSQTTVVVLSGFPCCVSQTPPTETDGPPGACAICKAALAFGHRTVLVTDDCNAQVFQTAAAHLLSTKTNFSFQSFSSVLTPSDQERLDNLTSTCGLLIACERAGPAKDGHCYTMRAIDMTAQGLIAPLHRLAESCRTRNVPFIAIGDGGNELGMGKVLDKIINNPKIGNGDTIGCVVAADYLIAVSVSNWGGYALAAGAAMVRAHHDANVTTTASEWVDQCLPTDQEEVDLLNRCVAVGCRDGVSGLMEATVDGMPLEKSLECLREIRKTAKGND